MTYSHIKNLFEEIKNEIEPIQSFIFGDVDRVLSPQMGKLKYPFMWLEIPDILPDVEGETITYETAVVILKNVGTGDWDKEDATLLEMESLLHQIIAKTQEKRTHFEVRINRQKAEYISRFSNDNCWGWRLPILLIAPFCFENDCEDC